MLSHLRKTLIWWPQVLWGLLIIGLTVNVGYLIWPIQSASVTISAHPSTLMQYTAPDTAPVLVEASDASGQVQEMLLPNAQATTGPVIRPSARKHAGHHAPHSNKKPVFTGNLNLNKASQADLMKLPGVGEKTAQRILDYRKEIGGFKSVEQLLDVSGIGPKKFAKMQGHCSI